MTRSPSGEVLVAEAGEADDFVPLPLATDLPRGSVVGDYTIECKLGDGGMATVYGATHPLIGKKAAIKVMNPALSRDAGLVERFVLEAQAVNHIRHPNIVDVFSFGQLSDGRSYFVMEWLPGETLYARLWERRLTLDEALDILDQMCDALEAAHDAGIVHRDLKPANVFLTPRRGRREQVKLLDFGVAKLTRASDEPLGLAGPQTQVGQVVGTPEYIAPEQARGKTVDGKCDVYAMGVISYEMILGQRPFAADNNADLVRLHLSEKPPSPRSLWPEIPSLLADLMLSMLEKKASDRPLPREVRAVIRELRGTPPPFEEGEGAFTPAPSSFGRLVAPSPPLPRRRLSRLALGLALIGFGGALAATIGWRLLQPAPPAAPPPAETTANARPTTPATAATAAATAATGNTTAASSAATAATANTTAPSPATTVAARAAPAGSVEVHVDAPDARIELDGVMVAQAASDARVTAAPGPHRLTVTAPGRKPFSSRVAVSVAHAVQVSVHLRGKGGPRPSPPPPPPSSAPVEQRHDPDYLVDPFSGAR